MAGLLFKVKSNEDNALVALLKMKKVVENSLDEIGELVAEDANALAPVGETGALSDSYEHIVMDKSVAIGSDLEYAPYVELGTGPHYTTPPAWLKNAAPRGHHESDPWRYLGDDGEWHMGWFVTARPHLSRAVMMNISMFKAIIRNNMENA